MTSKKRLHLHIGTHKTGSTSFQYFMRDHARVLSNAGFSFYEGMKEIENHLELHVAAMRPERMSFSKEKYEIADIESFRHEVANNVSRHYAAHPQSEPIFSAEGLALLRYPDELRTLGQLIEAERFDVRVLLVLRNRQAYLDSMRRQILKVPGRLPSQEPDSHRYVEDDSWLVDYDHIRKLWADEFGPDNLTVIDYDAARAANDGNIIPPMLDAIGAPTNLKNKSRGYRHNVDTRWAKIRRWVAKHKAF